MAQPIKVFVGSLPQGTKPEELRRLFENYGVVVECDVMNRCGFVHMKNALMAENAIEALHDSEFKGQNIVVEYGRPKERKQGNGVAGNQGGGRGTRGIMVGFPGKQISNKFNPAATLQLAGVIMELLGDQQNQVADISGGTNSMRSGGGDSGFRRGASGGGPQGGGVRGRGGNNQAGHRGVNQNMNGVGPMRHAGIKGDRSMPYPHSINVSGPNNTNAGSSHGGGRFGNQPHLGGQPNRGGKFVSKPAANNYGSGNSWSNDQRGGITQHSGRNFAEDNLSGGFCGNMGNSGGGNFGGQQDRRGFALPSNQFQQYGGGGGGSNQMGGFATNDSNASYADDTIYQRRNNNLSNAPIIIDFRSGGKGAGNVGGSNFNRGGNLGGNLGNRAGGVNRTGFQSSRGGQGFQQGGGFKRGGPSGNINSSDSYQQNFPALGGGQGGFGGNNRNYGGQVGRGAGINGGGMNRNAPRQNMPNHRY